MIIPSRFAFNSPILPFDRLMMRIFLLSITSSNLKADLVCPMMFLINLLVLKDTNFAEKYGMISCFSLSPIALNVLSRRFFTVGFVTFLILYSLYHSSVKSLTTSKSVGLSSKSSSSVSDPYLKYSCNLGPKISGQNILMKISVASLTTLSASSKILISNIFNPIGLSSSPASKYTTSFALSFGI